MTSVSQIDVQPGATAEVGLVLEPSGTLPAQGTNVSFDVTATSATNTSNTASATESFTVPSIDAVTVTGSTTSLNAIPGTPVTDTLTITNAGNVAESNVTLTSALSSGLALSGLSPVSLQPGQSTTETVTLTPAESTPLNSQLVATVTATFGPSGSPLTQTLTIPVAVEVPGASAIADAAATATQFGNTALAAQLDDLSTAITSLVQNPTDPVAESQTLASLDAVTGLLGADAFLTSLLPQFASARAAIASATTPTALLAAANTLGTSLDSLDSILTDEAAHNFTLSLLMNSQVEAPLSPATFQINLQNTGSQATTYDLSITGLPTGVTASFSQPSITLEPGQNTVGTVGVPQVTVTLTNSSTTSLLPFSFQVTATVDGATELTQSTTGSLISRAALVQVASVTPSPTFTQPGGQVDVSAEILNAVNEQQQAMVSYTVTDPSGNVIFTSTPVTTTLQVLTTLTKVDLGNLDTTGFAIGDDTINVTVTDASGNPIAGATGTGTLEIGTPVTATLVTTPATLPAGSGTVTTTLQINSQSTLGGTPLSVVSTTPVAGVTGVAILGTDSYVGAGSGIDIVDISNPAQPSVLSTFGTGDLDGAVGYRPPGLQQRAGRPRPAVRRRTIDSVDLLASQSHQSNPSGPDPDRVSIGH